MGGGGIVFYVTFLFSEKRIAGVEDSCCLTSRETIRLFRDGGGGGGGEIIYLLLHCHPQNDFCIKVGSDESHFNVS